MSEKIAFYRKYRPQSFGEIVGQEVIVKTLLNAARQNQFSHAYLFCGPRGTGKTSAARITAKAINCVNPQDGEPCNKCEHCEAINTGRHQDLIELDAASHTGVDDVRDLIEKAQFAPNFAKKKVYIIDEAHMLSKAAFNALLKTLEEPPNHVHFILATTEPHKLLVTIISRCQRFDFRRIGEADIVQQLKKIAKTEKIKTEEKALELIAYQTNGGMRDAIGLLEQLTEEGKLTTAQVEKNLGLTSLPVLEDLLAHLEKDETLEAVELVNDLTNRGVNLSQFVRDFLEATRQRMLSKIKQNEDWSFYLRVVEVFGEAGQAVKQSFIPQLPLEVACVKLRQTESTPAPKPAPASPAPEPAAQKTAKPKEPGTEPDAKAKKSKKVAEEAGDEARATQEWSDAAWREMRETLSNNQLKLTLRSAEPRYAEGELTILVNSEFHEKILNKIGNQEALRQASQKILGEGVEIKVEKTDEKLQAIGAKNQGEAHEGDVAEIFGTW